MSQEDILINKEDYIEDEDIDTEEEELDEVTQEAISMGWRPKEEYEGPEEDWIDAAEFVGRAPLYNNLNKQKKRIKRLEKAINELAEHNRRIAVATKEQHLDDLKQARREAMKEDDFDAIEKIDEEIQKTSSTEVPASIDPVFQDWLDDNEWYIDDPDMAAIANSHGMRLKQLSPDTPAEEILNKVTEYIKKKFPDNFGVPKETKKVMPNGGDSPPRRSTKSTYQPTPEERKMAREFVELGVFDSEQEYYKQLKATNRN